MGYPELQFYPPAFAWMGKLLHVAALGLLPLEANYQMLVWLVYLAPGVTAYFLLARAVGNAWLALPGAFIVLTLSAGVASGVEGGVRVGMVAARFGWALLPLLLLVLSRWIDGRLPHGAAPLVIAAITLFHPAHLPAAVVLVLLAAVRREAPVDVPRDIRAHVRRDGVRRRCLDAVSVLGLAALLTAVWTLPLVARISETRALAWGSLTTDGPLVGLTRDPLLMTLVVLAGVAIRVARSPLELVIARFPWAMAVVVAADTFIAELLGLRWLPADRVIDSAALAVVLAAGLTLAKFAAPVVGQVTGARRFTAPGAVLATVIAVVALSWPAGSLTLWPRRTAWPTLGTIERGMQLRALWSKLAAAPPGRILFVRSSLPLVYGTEWYRPHTHITALTPAMTGRAIVNGTFTHSSPIAALVYRGSADRGAITELVERLDGRSLFGRPLAELDAATLDRFADRLGVSTIVALEDDVPSLATLREGGAFAALALPPPFVGFARRTAVRVPQRTAPDQWTLDVADSTGPWVSARTAYYPLWQAWADGRKISVRRGTLGDLEIRPEGAGTPVTLTYAPGVPEIAGVGISAAAAILWALVAVRGRVRQPRTASAPATAQR
jgi:hypothetical protein